MNSPTIRQILFPTDYSDASRAAGQLAAELARHFNAKLHVVHVVPPVTDPGPAGAMASAVAELGPGVDFVTTVVLGRIAAQIVSYAGRHDIDMIVMGTRGRTSVSRAVLGSVAAAVVRRASCPVLTVPESTKSLSVPDDAPGA
ncbi:MAG TPA: universal stress protein [Methylomirabilota bacterium]|jgi:nucleotide-binding universal stress UspA family protein